MPMTKSNIYWIIFSFSSLLTLLAYKEAWALSGYWALLSCLALVTVFVGFKLLQSTGWNPWSIVGVVVGLLIGQWWIVQMIAARLFFMWRGFAP
jgi:hypothetical protein